MVTEAGRGDAALVTDAAAVLDALGDPTRRRILELLAAGPASVGAIAAQLPISRPAVSRHLKLLRNVNLVADEPQGTRHIFSLRQGGIDAVRGYFDELWTDAAARYRLVAENTEPADP